MERTKCEIYTRVMGYYRPISHYNIWKKAEYYNRKNFNYDQSMNSQFIKQYG